ncbi:MAG: radical SAM family heme chaperone HemW [Candidatus Babeliaceae bacterium]
MFDPMCRVESVYLHWPFCPYKCHFCPFVALAAHDQYMEQYHKALCKEVALFAQQRTDTIDLKTLFLGGGTPSTYPCDYLLDMFDRLNTVFTFTKDAEISIEVNPGTVTMQRLETWKKVGINRLSIGVQSLNDGVLTSLNRHQKRTDVLKLVYDADKLFENISIDLILGLPQVSHDEWKQTIKEVTTWPLKHISVYFLMIHENTPLYFTVRKKQVTLPADDEVVEVYKWTVDYLHEKGFIQYEISNFARPGYHSRHNTAYWMRVPYKGFGLGACSFDGISRFQNEKNLMKYCNNIERNQDITFFHETLNVQQVWIEKLMLGLRQIKGVLLSDILEDIPPDNFEHFMGRVTTLYQKGLLRKTEDGIALTYEGLAVENEIILTLSSHYNN